MQMQSDIIEILSFWCVCKIELGLTITLKFTLTINNNNKKHPCQTLKFNDIYQETRRLLPDVVINCFKLHKKSIEIYPIPEVIRLDNLKT